jgi:hypothetical protein
MHQRKEAVHGFLQIVVPLHYSNDYMKQIEWKGRFYGLCVQKTKKPASLEGGVHLQTSLAKIEGVRMKTRA